MGQQIGGLALMLGGRLLGGFIGGPIGGAIGGLAGGIIGSLLFNRASKPLVQDAQLATSSYGHFIPILYGQGRFAATVIWETDIETKEHTVGKGGSFGQSVNSYLQSAAFAFCQGPARLMKVWLDGKLFYDATSIYPVEQTKHPFLARIYQGDEEQLPDPLVAEWVLTHVSASFACPAYRGLAYIVFQQVDLSNYGSRMPQVTASWATDWDDHMVEKQLRRFANDVSGDTGFTGYQSGVAVDWVRFRTYQLSSDGTLRVYDMGTGNPVQAVTYDTMSFGGGSVSLHPPIDFFNIAVCPGSSFVYITVEDATGPWLLAVNQATMRIEYTLPLWDSHSIWDVEWPATVVPFQLVSILADPADMLLIATYNWEIWYVVNPKTGNNSGVLPLHYNSGFPGGYFADACVGKQDIVGGVVELWIVQTGPGGFAHDPDYLYIHRVTVTGDDPSGIVPMGMCEEVGKIQPSDLGLTDHVTGGLDTFWWTPKVVYDASDDTLIISAPAIGQVSFKWKEGLGVLWQSPQGRAAISGSAITPYYTTNAGQVGSSNGNDHWVTQIMRGDQSDTYHTSAPTLVTGTVWAYNSLLNAEVINNGNDLWIIYLQRAVSGDVPVADILVDLCTRAGIDRDSIDVTSVTERTVGYTVSEEKSFGNAVMDLCHTFSIDMTESDYKLKFVQRGQGPIVTIPQADLASADKNDPSKYWDEKRAIEQEMPLQINVRYADVDLDFQPGASYSKRIALPGAQTVFSRRVKTLDLPVVAHNQDARHIAETWLYTMWAERNTYKTMLGQKYLWLDPTDNIVVSFDQGDSITVRIQTTDVGDDYSLKLDMASEDVETFVTSTSPGADISFVPQTITQSGFIELLQFNCPLLLDTDDTGGTQMRIYYAGGPTAPQTSSTTAQLYQSTDGSAWPLFADMVSFANWGTTGEALGDTVAAFATDYVNTLRFTLAGGSEAPASCSYLELMNGANPALVGREIIQFMVVQTISPGVYELSVLLRGRRGTEWACGAHAIGENIIFLELAKIQPGRLPLTQRGQTTLWKLVPSGRFLDSTPADSFAYRAFDLMPYAPVNPKRTVSGSNLVLTWIRRTRIGGLQVDGSDTAPLSEESELYEVYLLDSAADLANFDPTTPTTYRRAFTGLTTSSLTYTAADMGADGFDMGADTLFAVIYQISAVVGRGFPGFHELPPLVLGLTVGLEDGTGSWASLGGAWLWG